jgi:C4-dicarboxylate-specific signal transduction histidine kinase
VRIALVILLITLGSYVHALRTLRNESLTRLEQYVSERSQREQAIFRLAEDNHALLKQALEERIQAWRQQDPDARFDSLFARLPDGSIRNQPHGFDGTRMPGVIVTRGVKEAPDFRRKLLAAQEVVAQYGPALRARFVDTYVILPEGAETVYWPEAPDWCQEIEADFPLVTYDFFTLSQPERNPQRRTAWTGIFEDVPSKRWMVSGITPLDMDGRHVATVGHDVLLDELLARTQRELLPGAYNLIFRDDGQLIAHPALKLESGAAVYNILDTPPPGTAPRLGSEEQQAHLRAIFERIRQRAPGQTVLELPKHDEYLAVARIAGPDWNFITVLPKHQVTSAAVHAASNVLLAGAAALVLELAILFWVLRTHITRPLRTFTQAAAQVEAGDFQVSLAPTRGDELGQLAHAFQRMSQEVRRREEALKQANEGLEQRVEERTREMKELHQQLLETARRAGMAEVATSVLHNVGNVLTSVNTSASVAKERLAAMRHEQVSRLAELLEEQADLSHFLTQDERGRNVLPFLRHLGQHMQNEHQAIHQLLEEVGQHTDHIAAIIRMQQRHARNPQLQEPISLTELMEDALRINATGLSRHSVQVERHLESLPVTVTDKHKVLTILVNLISNAKYAMDDVPVGQRRLKVSLERLRPDRVRMQVQDSGVGIKPELLTHIFQYGFTTRTEGHGFGLHSSALAAQELGGALHAHSDGPGQGATFTLELPYVPAGEQPLA